MQITVRSIKSKYSESIYLSDLKTFEKIFEKFSTLKNPLEVDIFAINELLKSDQLSKLKHSAKKLNIDYLHIYSNSRETILTGKALKIDSTLMKEEKLKNKLFTSISKSEEDLLHKGTIRSGDRISSNGNLFIIGDVNPGAIISARKNVYVWGKLLGIAFAGDNGNKDASIASLYLNPLQLRISEFIAIGPKEKPNDYYPEIAVVDKESIIIKPLLLDSQKNSMI